MPSIIGMTQSAFDPASRVRFIQFIPGLRALGWEVDHRPNLPDRQWLSPLRRRVLRAVHYRLGRAKRKWNRWRDVRDAAGFDVALVNRDLAGGGLFFEKRLLKANPRVVFDFDDAIYIGRNEYAVRWMCEHAAWVTPGNPYLSEFVRRYTDRFTVIPTVVDTDRYVPRTHADEPHRGRVRIGWSGSDRSIHTTLFQHLEMLTRLQKKLDFDFVIVTNTKPHIPVSDFRWTFHEWNEEDEYRIGAVMDVGLMPLLDHEFHRGKCGLKLLQYMAAGIPTVATPVGVNSEITLQGKTGFLAMKDKEWEDALATLVESPELRARMGCEGRRICDEQWSIKRWLPELTKIFDRVRDGQS